ncbi:MAG: D-arabinose 5-phosphate isomerase [Chitinophagaceae bacterium]|nr:D-arabinose 5-phosphate isomerase [Chitinophagaceae bacterium]MDB5222983.1 D-arabinose 5-phosphate isomerase [Chitinophagaceae bacterium]
MQKPDIIFLAKQTILQEAEAVAGIASFINDDFNKIIDLIINCKGRLVLSGIGKSAIVAQKIVATLNSTGTPSLFMHAADAIHGDVGMIQQEDVVIIISKSGDSPEIKVLVPIVKNFGNKIIGMVGQTESYLAKQADLILNTTVSKEACPNNLAPTSSTTAQMVMGDAIAICLMHAKGFSVDEFAKFHPGGTLGKKLYLKVSDLALHNEKPQVDETSSLKDVIVEITKKRLGATVVLDKKEHIAGIITDGDLRRMLEKNVLLQNVIAKDIMSVNPKTISQNHLAVDALDLMRKNNISQLLVVDNEKYAGIIHLHDLVREGII